MIKAVIFDVGGVISNVNYNKFNSSLDSLAKDFNVDVDLFLKLRKKYFLYTIVGKMSESQYMRKIMLEINVNNKRLFSKRWKDSLSKSMQINKSVNSIINKLSKNYILATLSNVTEMFHDTRVNQNLYCAFDYNFSSYAYGMIKPNIKFYKLAIKKLKMKPEEIVFIDDQKNNLIPAKKLGMNVICFKDAISLKKELVKLGIKI